MYIVRMLLLLLGNTRSKVCTAYVYLLPVIEFQLLELCHVRIRYNAVQFLDNRVITVKMSSR